VVRYCAESSRHREMQMGTADVRTCSSGRRDHSVHRRSSCVSVLSPADPVHVDPPILFTVTRS